MTVKEIKNQSRQILTKRAGDCMSFTLFVFSFAAFLILCELTIYVVLRMAGWEWVYNIRLIRKSEYVRNFWLIKLILVSLLLMSENTIFRRMFIDILAGGNHISTRQYISAHAGEYYFKAVASSFIYNLLKVIMSVPIFIGMYGIYYWSYTSRLKELTSVGLFFFMLSFGLTVVWTGVFIYYCISISLTPYIMALNPRANVFDACDLSVRLMDGQHYKYIRFVLSYIKYIPLLFFVYPIYILFPYFMLGYTVFVKDIMGDYWQDKMPAMIKRWKKYL